MTLRDSSVNTFQIDRAANRRECVWESLADKPATLAEDKPPPMGAGAAIRELHALVSHVAWSQAPILIQSEAGATVFDGGHARDKIEIDEVFTLKALGGANERCIACEVVKLPGRRLLVKLSGYISRDTVIRIGATTPSCWAALACWNEGPGPDIFAAIRTAPGHFRTYRNGAIPAKFSGTTYPLNLVVRQVRLTVIS